MEEFQVIEGKGKSRTVLCIAVAYLCGLILPLCVMGVPRDAQSGPAKVLRGREIFLKQCADCHGEDGSGVFGPDLTDQFWLHGYTKGEVHATITNGVPGTGMPAWGESLTEDELESIAEFVLSLSESPLSLSTA